MNLTGLANHFMDLINYIDDSVAFLQDNNVESNTIPCPTVENAIYNDRTDSNENDTRKMRKLGDDTNGIHTDVCPTTFQSNDIRGFGNGNISTSNRLNLFARKRIQNCSYIDNGRPSILSALDEVKNFKESDDDLTNIDNVMKMIDNMFNTICSEPPENLEQKNKFEQHRKDVPIKNAKDAEHEKIKGDSETKTESGSIAKVLIDISKSEQDITEEGKVENTPVVCHPMTLGEVNELNFKRYLASQLEKIQQKRKEVHKDLQEELKKKKQVRRVLKELDEKNDRYQGCIHENFKQLERAEDEKKRLRMEIEIFKDKTAFIRRGKDGSLPSGVFFLDLLKIEPHHADANQNLISMRYLMDREKVLRDNISKLMNEIDEERRVTKENDYK